MPTSDAEHLAAREAIDQLMEGIREHQAKKGANRVRIADAVDGRNIAREWAVVEDEGGQVEGLALLYHSTNPAEVAAYLRGWLTAQEVHDADA